MGKLSEVAKAMKSASESGASKLRAQERAWASEAKGRKGQLSGLSEYFAHVDKPRSASVSAPAKAPQERRAEVDRTVPRERRTGTGEKINLRRRAEDAENLASGYRAFADEMDMDPRSHQYFVDANKLKALNDKFGFTVGDRLIELQNQHLRDELELLPEHVKPIIARGPGDEVFLAGNDDAIMREAIERANNKLITEGVHMELPGGAKRTISGVASLKYGAGPTLDDAEADLMARKSSAIDDRASAPEAIDVLEEPREREGSLKVIGKYISRAGGGLVPMASRYPDAFDGVYEDGDEFLGEDDDYEYYSCGGPVNKGIGGFLKKAVKKVAKVGKIAAPILGKIPGVGTVAGGVLGGLSGLIADGNLKGALSGALDGVSGGLSGIAKMGTTVGSAALDMSNAKKKAKKQGKSAQLVQQATQDSTQESPSSSPKFDLAALRRSALDAVSQAPTQLSMVQPSHQAGPRPSIGLLSQVGSRVS